MTMTVLTNDFIGMSEVARILGVTRAGAHYLRDVGQVQPVMRTPIGDLYLRREIEALRDARASREAE